MIIVISAANADVCLSMARIIKMDENYRSAKLIGLTPDDIWPAQKYFDEIKKIPLADHPSYGPSLKKIIDDIKPDIFIPFSEAELGWFVENPEILDTLSCRKIINPLNILGNFLDKEKTANYLKSIGVPTPITYSIKNIETITRPLIIKPRRGAGSKNITIVRNDAQLEGFLQQYETQHDNFIAQEFIDAADAEFTCALWRGNDILRYCTFRRRLQGGMTGVARVEQHIAIDQALEKIAKSLEGDFFINVQLRLRNDIPYVFEINPRFSSTIMMRHKIGFKDLIWTLDLYSKQMNVPLWNPPLDTVIFRLSDECVISAEGNMA